MFKYELKYFLIIFFIFISCLFFNPSVVKATIYCDVVVSSISDKTVTTSWQVQSDSANQYYNVSFQWDNNGVYFIGKQAGVFDFQVTGTETYTYSTYGSHFATVSSGSCVNSVDFDIPDPTPQVGTICVDANISTQVTISGVGVGNPSRCDSVPAGTYTVTGASVSGYSGPSYSNGQSLTVPVGGAVSTFLTYTPNPTGRYKCLATNQCGWDPNDSGPDQCNTNADCAASNSAPNAPTISGSTSGYTNTSYTYSFSATDPDGNQVKYGVDWSVPADGVVDEWVPSSGLVNSGTSRSTSHSWTTTGTKTIKALTQDSNGANSAWAGPYNVSITTAPSSINGACGPNATTFSSASTDYSGTSNTDFCSAGTASPPSPTFPSAGGSSSWSCLGSGGGTNASCSASRDSSPLGDYSLRVDKTVGGFVQSTTDNSIDCGSTCSSNYAQNSSVTLQAYPASSYWKFDGWTGDCTGTGLCSLIINGAKAVTATFSLRSFNYNEF
ncbi:MAG: putative cell-wall-anchored protein SasA [Parcubacteria bacterium C7867-006]|nr:MAG: putative cell-wall-anchored protein SasA [Parcubacteria bacterium C7867-006]